MIKQLFELLDEIKEETGNTPKIEIQEAECGYSVMVGWFEPGGRCMSFRRYITQKELKETDGERVIEDLAEMVRRGGT